MPIHQNVTSKFVIVQTDGIPSHKRKQTFLISYSPFRTLARSYVTTPQDLLHLLHPSSLNPSPPPFSPLKKRMHSGSISGPSSGSGSTCHPRIFNILLDTRATISYN